MGCAESRNTVQPQGAFSVVTSSSSPAGFFHRSAATSNNTGSSAPTAAAAKAAKKKCRLRKTSTLFPEPQASTTAASITTTSQNADAQTRCTSPSVAEIAHAKGNAASSSSSTSTVTPLPTFVNGPSLQLLPTEKQNLQHLTFEELSLQFLKAVKNGDVAFVERLEQQAAKLSPSPPAGGLINIRGMWESTPLIYACQYGHAKAAMWLLQQGANVHCQNEKGMTALLLASLEGMTDIVEWILAKYATSPIKVDTPATGDKLSEHLSIDKQIGVVYNSVADLNIRVNPLLAASMNGHVDIVTKLLTARDASNNSVSVDFGVAASASVASAKQFALLLAAKYGHASVVRVLIKHGADFATSDSNGNHALLLACEAAKDECAMELLRLLPGTREVEGSGAADSPVPPPSNAYIATWKHANAHGLTALHFAAANGLLHVVQRMVVTLQ
ncbi:Peptidylprolyl isomerase domain and wd repeat-containing protein 1, partial [Globisporangium splendens]